MKKFLVTLLVTALLCVMAEQAFAQKYREVEEAAPEEIPPEQWYLQLNYTNIFDNTFSSDAISGEAGWYLLDKIDVSTNFWGQAKMAIGPFATLSMNSGILNNKDYAEQLILWTAGASFRINFSQSIMTINAMLGQLTGYFTMQSGFETKRQDFIYSGEFSYESNSGRLLGELFIPAWKMSVAVSHPRSPQKLIDWGYQDLTNRLNDYGTNTYSVHASADLDLFDVPFSNKTKMPLTLRGFGGKYNPRNIKYFGLGGGTTYLYDNKPAVSLSIDRIWIWDNGKLDNVALNLTFFLSFFQQLW